MGTDQAIVLRVIKYSESDLVVTLFLKEGGLRKGIARGALRSRRRFGPALEAGNILRVTFQEKGEWLFLREASLEIPSPAWRRSYKAVVAAGFCLELAGRLSPEAREAKDKFALLECFLREVNETNAVEKLLVFESNWIEASGTAPPPPPGPSKPLRPADLQKILDAHWSSLLGSPLKSRKLLDVLFVV